MRVMTAGDLGEIRTFTFELESTQSNAGWPGWVQNLWRSHSKPRLTAVAHHRREMSGLCFTNLIGFQSRVDPGDKLVYMKGFVYLTKGDW